MGVLVSARENEEKEFAMYRKLNPWSALALVLVLVSLVGCSSGVEGTETESVMETDSGVAVLDTYDVTATVVGIDEVKNKVTFQTPDGKTTTCKAGKDVDLTVLKVGDQISIEVLEEVAVEIDKGGDVASIGAVGMASVAASDKETDVMTVDTVEMTAVVTALDAGKRKVTFTFVDGSTKTVKVDKKVDLSTIQVGDSVTVEVTEGVALSVKSV
jgi:hypothetical protein